MKKLLLILFLAAWSNAFGQFPIGNRTITFNDPARNNRAIQCEVYYPGVSAGNNAVVATGEFPIIIFGHGFTMQPTAYPNWKDEFVPDGYIMIFPGTETSFSPSHEAFGLDIRFLANQMQAEGQNSSSPFYQRVSNRTAMMGHSMGGGSAFLAASGFAGVDCIVGLAPAETNPSAVSAAANVSAPTMVLSGTSDGVTPPADHHIPIYNGVGSACKYFVNIQDGSHCRFASNPGLCTVGEFIPGSLSAADQQAVSYAVCHPWFDYFLKDDCDAWDDYLTALSTETDLGTINSDCVNDAPVISDNNGTLESDQQSNYQWYLNGSEVPNENAQTHVYAQSGTYQVGTTTLGNCPTLSNEIVVQITGGVEREINLSTYGERIQLKSRDKLDNVVLEWFDLSGKLVASIAVSTMTANNSITIEEPNYVGLKLLRLTSNQAAKTWKLF
ncbi:MAG: dienelactone hydrolase family protein [Flavobacteriales bacterium]|nr:dienelactone hydrolase family protein [Flavobacteriales bacterium]